MFIFPAEKAGSFISSVAIPSHFTTLFSVQFPVFYILGYMLAFTLGHTDDKLVVTLSEFVTITEPYFLFLFTHVTTKQVVPVIYSTPDDMSDYGYRYNEFTINTQSVFGAYPIGEWHYTAYQQASSTNTDPDLTDGVLEYGKMILYPTTAFAYKEYNSQTTYKAYNG